MSEADELGEALSLPPALKLRFADDDGKIKIACTKDFKKVIDSLKDKDSGWKFHAVMVLASTEIEAKNFRASLHKTLADPAYKNIVIIDALSSYLGVEALDEYINYSAWASYYQGSNKTQSESDANRAEGILNREWRARIHDGNFIIFYASQVIQPINGAEKLHEKLREIVLKRFNYVQDFANKLTESQLKLTQAKSSAKYAIEAQGVKGVMAGCEKIILAKFWNNPDYIHDKSLENEPIFIIKQKIDSLIKNAFESHGKISISEIYDVLESQFGFSECNLSAFITGFLLKEYSSDPYRYMDEAGHTDTMTPDKLAEMIANYIGRPSSKPVYIASLSNEERAFYSYTEEIFNLAKNSCSSPVQAGAIIRARFRDLAFPVWCLEDVDRTGIFELVKIYIKLIQAKGDDSHNIANEIGKIFIRTPESAQELKNFLTPENCKSGMTAFLARFEDGKILSLANEINANDLVLNDVKKLFSVEYSAIWEKSTGESEIKKLITDYEFIKFTNILTNSAVKTKEAAFSAWREFVKFLNFS